MQNRLFIATCFFIITFLKFLPSRKRYGNLVIVNNNGSLPGLATFSLVCFIMAAVFLLINSIQFRKPLQGTFIIRRLNKNLSNEFSAIAIWVGFIIVSLFVAATNSFREIASYFLVFLVVFTFYQFMVKWLIQYMRPMHLSLGNNILFLKGYLWPRKRNLENLELVSYNKKQHAILFSFQEGLDNFTLRLTDFAVIDVLQLIRQINKESNREITMDEQFKEYILPLTADSTANKTNNEQS